MFSSLCVHFKMTRMDLFAVVKIKGLRDFNSIMEKAGVGHHATGCEICKPAIASILSSLYNDLIMKPQHHGSQETNDRFVESDSHIKSRN